MPGSGPHCNSAQRCALEWRFHLLRGGFGTARQVHISMRVFGLLLHLLLLLNIISSSIIDKESRNYFSYLPRSSDQKTRSMQPVRPVRPLGGPVVS